MNTSIKLKASLTRFRAKKKVALAWQKRAMVLQKCKKLISVAKVLTKAKKAGKTIWTTTMRTLTMKSRKTCQKLSMKRIKTMAQLAALTSEQVEESPLVNLLELILLLIPWRWKITITLSRWSGWHEFTSIFVN